MSPKSFLLSDALAAYVVAHSSPRDAVETRLATRTARLGEVAGMQIAPEQAAFMGWLVAALDVRVAVEVGTFTGLSALAIARGFRPGGHLTCFDRSEEWIDIAREHWRLAGVADRISVHLGDAAELLPVHAPAQIDFAFIDADKPGYLRYYETLLKNLSPHGVIVVDNTLWSGAVVDDSNHDDDTVALRAFNDYVATDERVDVVLLPVADGLTLIRHAGTGTTS